MKDNSKRSLLILWILFASIAARANHKSYDSARPLKEPHIFASGIISTGDYESHPAFSPDGNTLYFVKMAPDLTKWTIFVSFFKNGRWTQPEIAPFSGRYWDADPFFSKDGQTLYFISNRPLKEGETQKDFDIWKIVRSNNRWSAPIRLEPPINSESSEYYPTIADDGTMYFGSRRSGGKGGSDIYRSRLENGKYETAENLGEAVNTPGNEFEPFIAPDQSFLIFMATPTESLEQADFFVSKNNKEVWSRAKRLPEPFNSDATEFSPKITADLRYFFYCSTRNQHGPTFERAETTREMLKRIRESGNGLGDIYQIDFAELQKAMDSLP